jgi:hypothetical protein
MKNQQINSTTAVVKTTLLSAAFILMAVLAAFNAHAQDTLQVSDGKPINESAIADVSGSPDLNVDWADGTLTRKSGKQYTNLKLRYDAYNDQVVFEDIQSGNSLAPVFTDVSGFTMKGSDGDMTFANGFPAVDNQTPASFYQVIAGGKTQLLKHYSKMVKESQGFGDGSTTKNIEDSEAYYIFKNGTMTKVKADEKDITAVLSDKSQQLMAYAKSNHLGFKKEGDLNKIFTYYNTL